MKNIAIDTSPGPGGVIMQTLKHVKAAPGILNIANIMLVRNYVPKKPRIRRTVLIYKDKGNPADLEPMLILRRLAAVCTSLNQIKLTLAW